MSVVVLRIRSSQLVKMRSRNAVLQDCLDEHVLISELQEELGLDIVLGPHPAISIPRSDGHGQVGNIVPSSRTP